MGIWLPILLAIRTVTYFSFGLFHGLWRYTGLRDLISLLQAAGTSTAVFVLYVHFIGPQGFPRSVYAIDWLLSIFAVGGLRISIRTFREMTRHIASASDEGERRKKILIVGAGDAGEMLMREIGKTHAGRYEVVGFVDDNPSKQRELIHGVPVLGPLAPCRDREARGRRGGHRGHPLGQGPGHAPHRGGVPHRGARIRTIPGVDHLIEGRVQVNQIRNVAIEDLLGREPVTLDTQLIAGHLNGARGDGHRRGRLHRLRAVPPGVPLRPRAARAGRAGRERALSDPPELQNAWHRATSTLVPRIGRHLRHPPHGAGLRPVPPAGGVPRRGAQARADDGVEPRRGDQEQRAGHAQGGRPRRPHGVQQFVMISTDKAVNPTSIMGVPRSAWRRSTARRSRSARKTRFITVRFGNVLGSNGSVVPIFQEQIARAGRSRSRTRR
jgi:FlaA1/EpsC-like NDP-sugar epimerase